MVEAGTCTAVGEFTMVEGAAWGLGPSPSSENYEQLIAAITDKDKVTGAPTPQG